MVSHTLLLLVPVFCVILVLVLRVLVKSALVLTLLLHVLGVITTKSCALAFEVIALYSK